nr:PEP/pyruvate-binding domain-containing protein [Hymenobacter sp. HDW8]
MAQEAYTRFFRELTNQQVALVGGKNASLGELFNQLIPKGINVPDGFATAAAAYWQFLDENQLRQPLTTLLASLDEKELTNLSAVGTQARALLTQAKMPPA